MNDRQRKILALLAEKKKAAVNDLIDDMNVSGVTIRGDLDLLQKRGFIQRVHGGAILQGENEISHRLGINYEAKNAIAEKAAAMISQGETIFIEAGSANVLLARQLADESELTVVTNNVFITRTFKNSEVDVILLGGLYQHHSECVVGALAHQGLERINFSKIFLGVDGISLSGGITCSEMSRGELSTLAAKRSREVFILSDSSKIGKTAMFQVCEINAVNYLITDSGIAADMVSRFEEIGMKVIIAG